ncbi:MAG: DUF222 domain-containing protein [Ilumatobacteraceae bacterium]
MATSVRTDLERVLDALAAVADDLGGLDIAALSRQQLADGTLRLATLIDRLTAGQARLVAEADRAAVWAASGSRNIAGWLADHANTSYGRATELVRRADSIGSNALLADRVASGEMSAATAVALHHAVVSPPPGADANDVDALVAMCTGTGPRDAKAAAEVWAAQHQSISDDELEARRHHWRSVQFSAPADGMVTMTAVLPTLAANSVRKALCSLARLQAGGTGQAGESVGGSAGNSAGGQARGSASGQVDGSEGDSSSHAPIAAPVDGRTTEQRLADALVQLATAATRGELSGREAPTLLVTIDLDSLEGRSDRPAITEFGDHVPAVAVRRLVDDAAIRAIVHRGPDVLGVGRDLRLATRTQYAALVARDGRCRWKGCHIPASWCEVDHLVPWHAGGRTDLDNLVLWCSHHHHRKHDAGVEVLGDAHHLQLRLADGTFIDCPPHGGIVQTAGRIAPAAGGEAIPDQSDRRQRSAAA